MVRLRRNGSIWILPVNADFRQALRNIKKLRSPGYRRQAVRPAVNKTASVLNKAMKRRARAVGEIEVLTKQHGYKKIPANQLAKSIGIRRKTYSRTGWVVAVVGPRFGYTAPGNVQPSAFAIFVEGLLSSDALVSNPSPFARPAVNESMTAMRFTFRKELAKGSARVVAKLRARGSIK